MGRPKYASKRSANRKVQPAAQNPKFNKFRQQARKQNGFSSKSDTTIIGRHHNRPTLALTEENLKAFQAMNSNLDDIQFGDSVINKNVEEEEEELKSDNLSSLDKEFTDDKMKTLKGYRDDQISEAQTFATNFTNCTNASFNTFMEKFDPNSGVQKEMLSILAATTEIINANGNDGTEEEYFEVLINTIFTCENVISLAANVILLYYVVRRLSPSKLREKYSQFQSITSQLLKKHLSDSNVTFVRFLLKSYTQFVKNLDLTDWEMADTQKGFSEIMLGLISCSKSRIRKLVHISIVQIVSDVQVKIKAHNIVNQSIDSPLVHPISRLIADYCRRRIENTNVEDATAALYTLNLFKEVLPFLDTPDMRSCCETIISLLTLDKPIIFTNCMQALENLFNSKSTNITGDLNDKLLKKLYEFVPEMENEQQFLVWSSVMKAGLLCAFVRDSQVFNDHFLKLFGQLCQTWQSTSQVLRGYATQCMNEMLYEAVKAHANFKPNVFIAIGESLRSYLTYKHSDSLKYVLRLLCTFFVLGSQDFDDIARKLFIQIVDLRDTFGTTELQDINFDKPTISLMKHRSVAFVLEIAPLQPIEESKLIRNFWLVNAIKQQTRPLQIGTFIKHILPVCEQISSNANNFVDDQGKSKDTNGWLYHHTELCSLIPVFFYQPSDVNESFKLIAKTLGNMLTHQPHTRPFVERALRQLINRCKTDQDRQEVGRFAKNYLPILLNLYFSSTLDKASKLTVFETMAHFFKVADASTLETYYDKAFESCAKEQDQKKKTLFLDILRLMICHVTDVKKVTDTFESALVTASNRQNPHEQKKSFRLVEELLKSQNYDLLRQHYADKGQDLYQNMVKYFAEHYSSINLLSSQASLVRIVEHMISSKYAESQIPVEQFNEFVVLLINILQSKKSAKLRQSTFSILYTLVKCSENGPVRCIEVLVQHLKDRANQFDRKATILYMLHNILLQYNEQLDKSIKTVLIKALLENFDNVENKKMVTTILIFIKDWFRVSSKEELLPFISLFIDYLNGIESPESLIYKYKIKNIVERLLKKYGHEIVIKLIDPKYHRLIKSMEKHILSEKKNKDKLESGKGKRGAIEFDDSEEEEEDDDDDDVVGDNNQDHIDARRKKSAKRWRFDEEDESEGLRMLQSKHLDDDEMEEVTPETNVKKTNPIVKRDEIIRIDKEGNIVESTAPVSSSTSGSAAGLKKLSNDQLLPTIDDHQLPTFNRKKKIDEDDSDDDDDDDDQQSKKSKNKNHNDKPMAARIMDKYRRKRGIHRDTTVTGEQYRSNRARGDMKKPGIPDPYAYLPLNRSTLNKRKTNKNQKQFKNLVKAAVKGARKSRY